MLTLIIGAAILFFMQVNFSSCAKETVTKTVTDTLTINDTVTVNKTDTLTSPRVYPVEGLWAGTSTDNSSSATFPFDISFYADGTVLCKAYAVGGPYYSDGTWALAGSTITCYITTVNSGTVNQTLIFTYSDTGTLTSGTWEDTYGASNTGVFSTFTPAN